MPRIALSGLMAALLLSAPSLGWAQITVETAQGPVTLDGVPQNVAVYDMAGLDTITALGVTPAGTIANVTVPALREKVAGVPAVGTLFEPDLEALAGIGPDLVVVGGRSSPQLGAVSQVAPAIDMSFGPDLLGDARARIEAYGAIFDRPDEAAEMTRTLDAALAELRAAADGRGRALIVMTNGPRMSAYGRQSRFGWIYEATGLEEAVSGLDAANHGQAISHEFIAQADPDWLLVVDRATAIGEDSQGSLETLRSALVEGTTAWQQDQVIQLDPGAAYISAGGYASTLAVLDQLTQALAE